ncbi:hypothetical protein CXF72_04080 [Psychromonas sp. MB-3u-54]|nr:hypothetical protein CXF72_04080 [Psychromonas sp. MB-3u-54]
MSVNFSFEATAHKFNAFGISTMKILIGFLISQERQDIYFLNHYIKGNIILELKITNIKPCKNQRLNRQCRLSKSSAENKKTKVFCASSALENQLAPSKRHRFLSGFSPLCD